MEPRGEKGKENKIREKMKILKHFSRKALYVVRVHVCAHTCICICILHWHIYVCISVCITYFATPLYTRSRVRTGTTKHSSRRRTKASNMPSWENVASPDGAHIDNDGDLDGDEERKRVVRAQPNRRDTLEVLVQSVLETEDETECDDDETSDGNTKVADDDHIYAGRSGRSKTSEAAAVSSKVQYTSAAEYSERLQRLRQEGDDKDDVDDGEVDKEEKERRKEKKRRKEDRQKLWMSGGSAGFANSLQSGLSQLASSTSEFLFAESSAANDEGMFTLSRIYAYTCVCVHIYIKLLCGGAKFNGALNKYMKYT